MTTFMISYDLKAPGKNYDELIKHLEGYGTYWHNLGSTWFVVTDKTAREVVDGCHEHMDANDRIVVTQASAPGAWNGFGEKASDWLKKYLR